MLYECTAQPTELFQQISSMMNHDITQNIIARSIFYWVGRIRYLNF